MANLTTPPASFFARFFPDLALSSIDLSPSPSEAWKPFYYHPHVSLIPGLQDKYLSLLLPIAIYWLVSAWFQLLDLLQLPFFEKYRLHEPEEVTKRNKVSARKVILMVLLQQIIQTILGIFVLEDEETARRQVFTDHQANMRSIGVFLAKAVCGTFGYKTGLSMLSSFGTPAVQWLYWWGLPIAQFWWAFFIMDAWQYALHRSFHESRFLYRHFHSHHHRLYVPYAFGALYNHPLEGLLLDSAGGALSHFLSLMTVRQGIVLFGFSTLKTVCDHGGYAFPWYLDPLHLLFPNCAEYHDVHHQMQGLRYNYSQPFFVHFDVVFGTRIGTERFAKMKDASQKRRERERAEREGKVASLDSAASSAIKPTSARANGNTADGSRQRLAAVADVGNDSDASVESIISGEKNPFVTTNLESYRAKAGA